jgi:hypothetical protein
MASPDSFRHMRLYRSEELTSLILPAFLRRLVYYGFDTGVRVTRSESVEAKAAWPNRGAASLQPGMVHHRSMLAAASFIPSTGPAFR